MPWFVLAVVLSSVFALVTNMSDLVGMMSWRFLPREVSKVDSVDSRELAFVCRAPIVSLQSTS